MNSEYISRRDVVAAYVEYDAGKKNRAIPADFSNWSWSDPNALDSELRRNGFKSGIIAGYKTWQAIRLSRVELLNCAVVRHVFTDFPRRPEGLPRALNQLVHYPEFQNWKPNNDTEWYDWLESGKPFRDDWPLILRPAKKSESPAKWYVEDGSGRAICFLRRLCNHPEEDGTARGYLGVEPDLDSIFMQTEFRELLERPHTNGWT